MKIPCGAQKLWADERPLSADGQAYFADRVDAMLNDPAKQEYFLIFMHRYWPRFRSAAIPKAPVLDCLKDVLAESASLRERVRVLEGVLSLVEGRCDHMTESDLQATHEDLSDISSLCRAALNDQSAAQKQEALPTEAMIDAAFLKMPNSAASKSASSTKPCLQPHQSHD